MMAGTGGIVIHLFLAIKEHIKSVDGKWMNRGAAEDKLPTLVLYGCLLPLPEDV